MAEIRTVTTLRRKRDEILATLKLYEKQVEQAKSDLSHVMAAIRIFEQEGDPKDAPRYADVHRIFKRGETWAICRDAIAKHGPMTTKDLVIECMKVRGLNTGDKVLARALGQRLVNSLSKQEMRGQIAKAGKRKGVLVWQLIPSAAK